MHQPIEFMSLASNDIGDRVRTQLLSVTSHNNSILASCLINVVYLTACCLYQIMMTLHFLSDVANDAESTQNQKLRHYR